MTARLTLLWLLGSALSFAPCHADTQRFAFHPPTLASGGATDAAMRDLAERVLPVYEEPDRLRYLANLSALQMVAGDDKAADATRQSLSNLRHSKKIGKPAGRSLLLDLYAQAKAMQAQDKAPFAQAFDKLLGKTLQRLDNQDAYAFTRWRGASPDSFQHALQRAFDRLRPASTISLPQAIALIQTYLSYDVHHQVSTLVDEQGHEDDQRRYVIENDVPISTAAGVVLQARVVRPKNLAKPLPSLLEFSIVPTHNDAIACAAHGYAGIMAYTRGTDSSRDRVVPFEHDGEDARAVIRWIAKQPWSDGRIGMYGEGYSGFAAWAAAKHLPSALKAIATSDAMAPGIDFPVQGRIYQNAALRWAATHTHSVGQAPNDTDAWWRALDQQWYRSGKRYRDLDRMAKMPNRVFRRWLNHPSYDLYWRKMIPFQQQFAKIDIPVLSMTGYFADDEAGSLYYYTQHLRYRPNADHTLLIGPYDDNGLRDQPSVVLRGYTIDPVAQIDLRALRFQWFDHVLKGEPLPPLLKHRVNYEMMGSNRWHHASSLAAMADGVRTLYLDADHASAQNQLSPTRPTADTSVSQSVDFADRGDAGWSAQTGIQRKWLDVHHGVVFVSAPLKHPLEINGRLSGQLDFKLNKMDVDLYLALYEQRPSGDYLSLSTSYELRASYARDRVHRHLLKAGERQQLSFTSTRMTSRKLQTGSRIILVLGINKRPDQEINYGSGKDVSAASIADARTPLKIRWYGSSHIELPILKLPPDEPKPKPKPAIVPKPKHALRSLAPSPAASASASK